jgi:hypothetical protein
MRGPLAPVVFVLAIATATGFLFMAVTGIMILWALPVIVLLLTFAARRFAKPASLQLKDSTFCTWQMLGIRPQQGGRA